MGHTIADIANEKRLMYNPKKAPTERVNKKCSWCAEEESIPGNFKLCDACDLAMNDERKRRNKEEKREKRAKSKETQSNTVESSDDASEQQVGSGMTASYQPDEDEELTNELAQPSELTNELEQPNELAQPSELPNTSIKLCMACNKIPIKGNRKYCDNTECQEIKAVRKSESDNLHKREGYLAKKALRMKVINDKTLFILDSYKNKDVEAFKNFTQIDKTNALYAFIAQLSPEEYDAVLMDLLAEPSNHVVEESVE